MNLTVLLRPPLVWLVVAEALLISLLGLVTWHVWQQRVAPIATAVAPLVPVPAPPRGASRPGAASAGAPVATPPVAPGQPHAGPTPGLRTDPDFLSREMDELNQVEATFEYLEWRVTSAIATGIQRYVTGVILPSIDRAERGR